MKLPFDAATLPCDSSCFHSSETTSQHKTFNMWQLALHLQWYSTRKCRRPGGKGFGGRSSCDLRFVRAAPVHITQQTGRRLITREENLLKGRKGGGDHYAPVEIKCKLLILWSEGDEGSLGKRESSAGTFAPDVRVNLKSNRIYFWRKPNCASTNTSGWSSFFSLACCLQRPVWDWKVMTQDTDREK